MTRGLESRLAKLEAVANDNDRGRIVIIEILGGTSRADMESAATRYLGPRSRSVLFMLQSHGGPPGGRVLLDVAGATHENWVDALDIIAKAEGAGAVLSDYKPGDVDLMDDETLDASLAFLEGRISEAERAEVDATMRAKYGADYDDMRRAPA